MNKIKTFFGKFRKKIAAVSVAAVSALAMSVSAFAEDGGSNVMSEAISSAGDTLKSEFSTLVTTLVPTLVGIAIVGLGIYAVVILFKMAKSLFSKAAG